MARGGARPGAGRKKKTETPPDWDGPAIADYSTLTPLEFWQALLRDPRTPFELRAMAADKAGPFMHAKPAPTPSGQGDLADLPNAGNKWVRAIRQVVN